jgi:benzoyl-CoA reductase/2-hydroxyglutaryl-CoA dehydratase subunit BcrC/BadD/HgdB
MQEERIEAHLRDRPAELEKLRKSGRKIIGYFPGNYVPEELIYAAGAVPICLIDGGNSHAADTALSVVPDVICPFARAQIGEKLVNTNPYYNMVDLFVAPITCQHLRKVAEIWEYRGYTDMFKLGVPHQYSGDYELEYFVDRLRVLKDHLQACTGNVITNEKISEAIDLYNRMRDLLKKISMMRCAPEIPLGSLEFVKLNHASFYADPVFMVDILDSIYQELMEKRQIAGAGVPRLLLLGPNIACGDYKVLELVKEAGGEIVVEEVCEGVRYYWQNIDNKGDLLQSLAKGYLVDRLPCAFMRNATRSRFDFALKLASEFNVSGVIWYELLNCETYDSESYYFACKMEEMNIPMLILESNYGDADIGPLKTRIEAFIEIVKGGIS